MLEHGSSVRPLPGETHSGDLALAWERGGTTMLALIDFLGHGSRAAKEASRVEGLLCATSTISPGEILEELHRDQRGRVGCVAGVCAVDAAAGAFVFAGVGDVSGVHVGQDLIETMVATAGLLGERSPSIREKAGQLEDRSLLILFTDGIEPWLGDRAPGSHYFRAPTALAAEIVDAHGRSDDDASCLVARFRERPRAR